jgi:hypothetical protein
VWDGLTRRLKVHLSYISTRTEVQWFSFGYNLSNNTFTDTCRNDSMLLFLYQLPFIINIGHSYSFLQHVCWWFMMLSLQDIGLMSIKLEMIIIWSKSSRQCSRVTRMNCRHVTRQMIELKLRVLLFFSLSPTLRRCATHVILWNLSNQSITYRFTQ